MSVALSRENKPKIFRVNRLVCMVFLPNPENKPQVNHINGIKSDNRLVNLEWCTAKENAQHAVSTGLMVGTKNAFKGHRGGGHFNARPVHKFSLNDAFIETFPSSYEASLSAGVSRGLILHVCDKKNLTAGGFKWKK